MCGPGSPPSIACQPNLSTSTVNQLLPSPSSPPSTCLVTSVCARYYASHPSKTSEDTLPFCVLALGQPHPLRIRSSLALLSMSNLLIRILTLPFTVLSLVLSRIFRGFPARLAWASHGGGSGSSSSHSGMHGEVDDKMIVDPTESSKFFLKLLRTYREGDGVDVESEGIWETRGGYNAALRRAKDDNMILMVVLISKEHEDNSRFIQ